DGCVSLLEHRVPRGIRRRCALPRVWGGPRAQATSIINIWRWTWRTSTTLRRRATSDISRVLQCATAWK
ncbi:unnamed protein product, partial [Ectocarpus fasciculatus]